MRARHAGEQRCCDEGLCHTGHEPRNGSWPLAKARQSRPVNTLSVGGHITISVNSAARPLVWRFGPLAALLLLAGTSPLRRRALPAARLASPSGAPNCRF
jgi:hypothetical protein